MKTTHDELFGVFNAEQHKKFTRQEHISYVWEGEMLTKKTYTRKYIPNSKNGHVDSYSSELV
jgi:hypothetical protein